MADTVSNKKRSEIMSKIHSGKRKKDWTRMESKVHNWLKAKHIEHTMMPNVAENPDVVINGGDAPVFIFLDGCFWHCCPTHYKRPKSRERYWAKHLERSNERRESRRKRLPYKWIRIWEHDVNNGKFKESIERIVRK